jgi:hypothetical protein
MKEGSMIKSKHEYMDMFSSQDNITPKSIVKYPLSNYNIKSKG